MDISILRYCLSLLLLAAITAAETNGTSDDESREPRVSGRIVKLYSGVKPEPYLCAGEGFQLDPNNCAAFYRCVKERSGKFTVFRYQCAPGTVYDPDLETCNHPGSTRRVECGGTLRSTSEPQLTTNMNEIDGAQSELPKPISTKVPIYAEQTTFKTPTVSWILSTERQKTPTNMPWESIYNRPNALSTSQTKLPSSKPDFSINTAPSTLILPPKLTQPSHSRRDEPCTSDGFMGDSENCRKFYRCVSNLRGGYAKYEFSCSESTVWDDEIQGCNHPWAVKRSKCGRSISYNDKSASTSIGSSITEAPIKDSAVYNGGFGYKSNKTVQQQLQISHGSDVTQTQVQISNREDVIQNQTQINYGDKIQNGDNSKYKQNQTQISYGTAVSQSQTQIDYGNKGVQTQLQIDHSKDSSQSQVQESATQSTTSTTKNKNSGKNECSESGFMGDSNDCKKFYRCVDNGRGYTKYEYSCGDGTLWDPEIEACNHAWAVKNCGSKGPTESTTQHTTSSEKSTESTTQHTKPTTGSITSQVTDTDDEDDVGYGNQNNQEISSSSTTSVATTAESTTTTQTSTSSTSTTRKPNEASTVCTTSGFMGDPNDCKLFYRCVDNGNGGFIKYEFKCGDGTVWDSSIEACNHAWAVKNCGGNIPSDNHKEETTTKKENTTPNDNVHTTVTLVQVTTQATTLLEEYDAGYGSQNQEPQETSTTKKTTSTTSKPTKPDTAKGNDCKSSGFMGDENDCKKFYRCVDNGNGSYLKYEFTCGQGTVWDPKIEACNHAWAVEKCGGSQSLTENGGPETTSQSSTAQSSTVTGSTSAHTTENSKETEMPQTTTSTTSSSTTISSSSGKCSSSGFMGDSNDCKKFYRCVDNGDGSYIRYEFTCGDGTVWDPKIEACNHAWAVEKCGGTGHSETSHAPDQTTQIMHDEEHDSGYATPSYETSESTQSTTSSSTTSTTVAPAGEAGICKNNGFMGDQNNCKKFYRCVDNGKGGYDRYEFQCGEGTVWDDSIEACNHAWAVKNCGGSTGSSTTYSQNENTTPYPSSSNNEGSQISTEKTTTTTKAQQESGQSMSDVCKQEGFYGDENDCKKFYRCVDNGKAGFTKYEFICGEGTSWNPQIQNCDHISSDRPCGRDTSHNSTTQEPTHLYDDMDQSTTTTKGTSTTTGKPSDNSNSTQTTKKPPRSDGKCNSEGFYANPTDCKKFYRCVDNGNGGYTKYDFNCGDGTVWDQEKQACDHDPGDGSCSSSSSSTHHTTSSQSEGTTSSYSTTKKEDTTESTKAPSTSGNQCTAEGFFAHPNDCKKFVRCVDNGNRGFTRYEFSCGDGTVWIQEIQACDHDNEVHSCNAQSGTTSQASNTESQTSGTSHSDKTTSTTESVPPNKENDEYSNEPVHDENNDCTSEGYFGDKQDCRKFYRCVDNGKGGYTKYDFVCGDGTAWDSDLQTCNHINEVQSCSGSTTPGNGNQQTTTNKNQAEIESSSSTTKATTTSESTSSSSSSSSSNSNNQDTCESEGYFGNSNDCKKFYRCVDNGKGGYTKYDFTCGDGTIWDQDITTCNHPQDVSNPSCGSNQGSEDTSTSSSSSSTTSSTTSSSSETTLSSTESGTSSSQNTSDCSQDSSKKPADNNITCDKAGYYAHPSDCKKFYRCVDWDGDGKRFSVFHFECGEGTIWDPALDTCNHEESVYPRRDCQTQSQNVGGETEGTTTTTEGSTSSTTEGSTSTTTEGTTSTTTEGSSTTTNEPTTQESTTSEQTTAQQTTSESTTTEQSNEQTTQQSTTQESTTSEQTTTQQSNTSDQTTTQQSTTSEQTTTQQSATSEQTTTQQSTTSEQTTTQQSTTSEQTTTQQSTTSEQTTEQQTTQQTTTSESTTQEATTSQQTTQQTTSPEQTTTQQSTISEQTTQQSTTTQESNTGEQTTEQTTTQQSTTSGDNTTEESNETTTEQSNTTTEQSTDGTTTTEQGSDGTTTTEQGSDETTSTVQSSDGTTTEQSTDRTTTEQTTDETTTAESTTEQSTTSTESDSGEDQSTTEASSTDEECPEIEDDQYLLVCPTSFRRHPKYCNMFYQCTEDDDTNEAKTAMFKCPNNTIYDESQTQCVTEDKAEKKCNGEIANKRRFKRLGSYYKDPIVADKDKLSCSSTGFFSFEKKSECAKGFLKCERSKKGDLRGYVYQCPDGYIYWSISKRCEKIESVRDCKRSSNDWSERWNIPIERHNIARS